MFTVRIIVHVVRDNCHTTFTQPKRLRSNLHTHHKTITKLEKQINLDFHDKQCYLIKYAN